jgi:hypothetical protein
MPQTCYYWQLKLCSPIDVGLLSEFITTKEKSAKERQEHSSQDGSTVQYKQLSTLIMSDPELTIDNI